MSKRPSSSRPAKRQAKAPRRSEAPSESDAARSPTNPSAGSPGIRQRVLFAVAAGALAAWLTLLAVIAYAT